MTFDFAPNWLDFVSTATPYSGPAPVASQPAKLPWAPPPPCAPASPSMIEVAALVEELFTEGTLSYEQLRSLSTLPELAALLGDALSSVPAGRRVARAR
ncbi:MAG: hypothetical protein H7Z12_08300 [Rhodospirillaceae bacterium]|nr:hypothetical protein [Rhodospirillales bacterium]